MKNTFIIALLWCSALSFGQTKETNATQTKQDTIKKKTILLEEVIVTGNIKTDPTLTIVKQDFTDKVVQPKNSGELFSDINGFSLIKRGNYAVDPSFRSNQYEQLNVQYDGGTKAFHACPNRMDPITTLVNPEEVTKIEIIKGPFSVRYGNTFGGIINMVTQNGNANGKIFGGSFSSGYESNGNSFVNILQLSSDLKKFDILADLSYRDYGNYEDGNQNEIPSSFSSIGYGLKMGYEFTENQRLQANFRQNFGRDILHAGLPMDTDEDNSSIGSLDYIFKSNASVFKGLTAKIYYSYVDHIMSNYNRPSFPTSEAIAKVNATTYGGKLETEWDLSPKWKLFTGIDMVNLSRDGGRDRLVKKNMAGVTLPTPLAFYDKIWQDSYNDTFGTFAEAKWFISEKSIVNLGARVDFVTSDAKDLDASFVVLYPNIDKRNETNFSGTISYKRLISPDYTLEMAFGRGTRAANIEERYIAYFNIGRDPYEYIGNPNLKAETNNQFELGLTGKEKWNGFFDQIKFGGSVYYSIYENYILAVVDETLIRKYNPTTPPIHPKVFRNIDNAFKTGFEVFGDLKFANYFNFLTEVAYVYTENKDFNESLPLTPPLVTRLKLSFEKGKFWASAQYTLTAEQPKIALSYDEIATQSYEVMDLKAGFKPIESLNIGVGVLNLFDQHYNNHLTFAFNNQADFGRVPITEPGRNFTFFVNYKF
jgi:iron complex outermembrane receptor protein